MKTANYGLTVVLAVFFGGCGSGKSPNVSPDPQEVVEQPKPLSTKNTIPPDSEIAGIERAVENGTRMLALNKNNFMAREKLVSGLIRRASVLGRVSDYDRMLPAAEEAVTLNDKDPQSYRLRAKARGALHRFDEALADLDKALELGADKGTIQEARASIVLGQGKYDEALEVAVARSAKAPTFGNLTIEAVVLGRMGKTAEAEAKFIEAEKAFKGVSASGLAWHFFERGSMYARSGDGDKATASFQEAVQRMPSYAHAVDHYADGLPPNQAEQHLRRILETSDDPEYRGALGHLLEKQKPGSGKALIGEARKGYEALMKKHPQAFADHAAAFYLDVVNEPDKAIEAAQINLDTRKVPAAYEVMLRALVAAKQNDKACEVADEAVALKYPTPRMKTAAAAAYTACGKADKAHALAAPEGHHHAHPHAH